MKSPLALAALVLALPALAQEQSGQRQRDPKEMAAKMSERLKSELKLSDAQAAKIGDILNKSMPERAALEKKLRAQEQLMHEQIRAELDNDQKERFDMMRARFKKMGGRGGVERQGKPGFGGGGRRPHKSGMSGIHPGGSEGERPERGGEEAPPQPAPEPPQEDGSAPPPSSDGD